MGTEYLNNKVFEAIIIAFQGSKKSKARYTLIIEELKETKQRKLSRKCCVKSVNIAIDEAQKIFDYQCSCFTQSQNDLANAFYTLARNIVNYAKFEMIDEDDAIQECIMIGFEKIDRFNPAKGKAFNYVTTLELNHLRQLYRSARNYKELKRRYQNFMEVKFDTTMFRNGKTIFGYNLGSNNRGD